MAETESYLCTAPHMVDDDDGRCFFPGEWYEVDSFGDRFKDYVEQGWLTKANVDRKASKKVQRAHEKALEEEVVS